ncbi:complement resistance protein TraT [Alishewanella sp. SMS8]|uniref:complement resistance protein TraT n=1 Tax=unclassified Alishewanella TaxID=2628974 RepID=UPI0027410574|nr:complement resistance protein TraT [Alishewanella sp. SMS8]MDP5036831.1 complement resistance protein TraT [Alishewanella sp.]MDP5187572.1 complement resistance protein TraT [Alishewanella sp.]MDP5458723.1 complement resistance protein TraT [Alishewanella sp. SMS8]
MSLLYKGAILSGLLLLSGCGALHTSVSKGKLDVQMRMSETIYLDPVEAELRTVFLDIRQTAAEYQRPLMRDVASLLTARGYQLVNTPSAAQYWLQVNIRTVLNQPPQQVLREQYGMSEQQIAEFMRPGSSVVANNTPATRRRASGPGVVYADAGFSTDLDTKDVVRALAVVAVIVGAEYVGNQLVKDKYFTLLADIQIAERIAPDSDELVLDQSEQRLWQGDSGQLELLWEQHTDRRKYQVKLLGFANKANLTWEEAEPSLHNGILRSLAGIF